MATTTTVSRVAALSLRWMTWRRENRVCLAPDRVSRVSGRPSPLRKHRPVIVARFSRANVNQSMDVNAVVWSPSTAGCMQRQRPPDYCAMLPTLLLCVGAAIVRPPFESLPRIRIGRSNCVEARSWKLEMFTSNSNVELCRAEQKCNKAMGGAVASVALSGRQSHYLEGLHSVALVTDAIHNKPQCYGS